MKSRVDPYTAQVLEIEEGSPCFMIETDAYLDPNAARSRIATWIGVCATDALIRFSFMININRKS